MTPLDDAALDAIERAAVREYYSPVVALVAEVRRLRAIERAARPCVECGTYESDRTGCEYPNVSMADWQALRAAMEAK